MKIETKYNRGDVVFVMRHDQPTAMRVEDIEIRVSYYGVSISYEIKKLGFWGQKETMGESRLFQTKKELLQSL
jgi:hypothetical protein